MNFSSEWDFQSDLQQPGRNMESDLSIGPWNQGKCIEITPLKALNMTKFLVALSAEEGLLIHMPRGVIWRSMTSLKLMQH